MIKGGGYGRGGSGWFSTLNANIFFRGYYLQSTKFPSLSVKESLIVSAANPAHSSEKEIGRSKYCKYLQDSVTIWSLGLG